MSCAWVLADALYGADSRLRRMLEDRGQPYVLAVRSNHALRFLEDWQLVQTNPATLAEEIDDGQWHALSAGEGSKGPRLYEWAWVALGWETGDGFERWLLLRRHRRDHQALAYYIAYAHAGVELAELAGACGPRWTIEECFLRAKSLSRT